jgi:hypothetical protein
MSKYLNYGYNKVMYNKKIKFYLKKEAKNEVAI